MNKKFLLAALAIPMAFTACTDDFGANETVIKETYVDGDKIHLGDDFVLTGTRADVEGESRSAWAISSVVSPSHTPSDSAEPFVSAPVPVCDKLAFSPYIS